MKGVASRAVADKNAEAEGETAFLIVGWVGGLLSAAPLSRWVLFRVGGWACVCVRARARVRCCV